MAMGDIQPTFANYPAYDSNSFTSISNNSWYHAPECIGGHEILPESVVEYPDGQLVSACKACGCRVILHFPEENLLLRRVHQIAIAVTEATPGQAAQFVEAYHRLVERVERSSEQLEESRALMSRILEMLQKKVKESCE